MDDYKTVKRKGKEEAKTPKTRSDLSVGAWNMNKTET